MCYNYSITISSKIFEEKGGKDMSQNKTTLETQIKKEKELETFAKVDTEHLPEYMLRRAFGKSLDIMDEEDICDFPNH